MDTDLARLQWADGHRRIEAARADRPRYERLTAQVEVVVASRRRPNRQTFTLGELAEAYDGADEWTRTLLEDVDPDAPPVLEPGTVADAAFHQYARGAVDYAP